MREKGKGELMIMSLLGKMKALALCQWFRALVLYLCKYVSWCNINTSGLICWLVRRVPSPPPPPIVLESSPAPCPFSLNTSVGAQFPPPPDLSSCFLLSHVGRGTFQKIVAIICHRKLPSNPGREKKIADLLVICADGNAPAWGSVFMKKGLSHILNDISLKTESHSHLSWVHTVLLTNSHSLLQV